MKWWATLVFGMALVAGLPPATAGERTVHIFGGAYHFDFAPDYKYVERVTGDGGAREIVSFAAGNRSIIISGAKYKASNTAPLMSREDFVKRAGDGATAITYVNEEKKNGAAGSHLVGFCRGESCLYAASRAIGRRLWLNVEVACDSCTPADAKDVADRAAALYAQIKTF